MKKCAPGVICVENVTLLLLCIIMLVLGCFIYINSKESKEIKINIEEQKQYDFPRKDVLLNPYDPPLSNERLMQETYRQMGIMTPLNGSSKDNILPLMGRPLYSKRDKWQYYTISNQHNNVKLPISFKGKSALNDYGVDQIYSGDTVYIEGYGEAFKVTVYENDTIRYLPFV
jgi:hypothetical protein